jgi:hypothetical protein
LLPWEGAKNIIRHSRVERVRIANLTDENAKYTTMAMHGSLFNRSSFHGERETRQVAAHEKYRVINIFDFLHAKKTCQKNATMNADAF